MTPPTRLQELVRQRNAERLEIERLKTEIDLLLKRAKLQPSPAFMRLYNEELERARYCRDVTET